MFGLFVLTECRDLSRRGDLCLEVGDALVVEPEVLACGLEFLFEGAVAGGEGADALLERGVLGGGRLTSLAGEFAFGVAGLIGQLPRCGRAGARISAWAALRTLSALSARSRPDVPARLLSGLVALPLGGMRGAPSRQASHVTSRRVGSDYLADERPRAHCNPANQSEPPQVSSLPMAQIRWHRTAAAP